MRWVPHVFQKRGIKWIIQHACAALFWDPGMGKTTTMLAAFKILLAQGMVRKMFVIAPLRPAYSTWPGEVAKWDEFNELKVHVIHGEGWTRWWEVDADIFVINPEGLGRLFKEVGEHYGHNEWPWDLLCVDESTRFKHTNTQRFKLLKPHLPKFKRRYILTGTPAPNGLLDLFGQIFILDLGKSLGRFITNYRVNYFNPDHMGWNWTLREGSASLIYEKIKPLALRMEASDYLELPPLVFNRVEVELPPEARRAYREMEALLIADIAGGKITAANAGVATNKCRQIANGGIYGSELGAGSGGDNLSGGSGRVVHHLHEAKVDAVEEIVEELQGIPALVAFEFDHDLERLQKRFGRGVPFIAGGVSPKRFREIEAAWNHGELPLLLAQPQSVAHGLNLQGTRAHVIEHSIGWDLENRIQLIDRVWRQGQTDRVVVHSVVAKDTIDEVVVSVLASKDKTQKALLSALKGRYRA